MMKNNHSESVPSLLARHLEHLKGSGISDSVISERGYCSVTEAKYLVEVGFSRSQIRVPGILMPLWGVDGNGIVGNQFRPDNPRAGKNGKFIKYETPRGAVNRIDCPPRCRQYLGDPSVPLWITEGLKKGDCLTSLNQCVIALTGIWNWKGKNKHGGVTFSSDFDYIALNGRKVYLAPDSDFSTNKSVRKAALRLAEHLSRKGAKVSIVVLPASNDGEKIGLDDFIVKGHSLAELEALAMPIAGMESTEEGGKQLYRNYLYFNNRLYLEIRKYDGGYGFARVGEKGKVGINSQVIAGGQAINPRPLPENEGKPVPIVGMPDENINGTHLLSPDELYEKLSKHIATYVDLPDLDLELCILYTFFTWFYLKVQTLGYLRFLADTGKGKSRSQKVVGDLCFYPVFASGVSSFYS